MFINVQIQLYKPEPRVYMSHVPVVPVGRKLAGILHPCTLAAIMNGVVHCVTTGLTTAGISLSAVSLVRPVVFCVARIGGVMSVSHHGTSLLIPTEPFPATSFHHFSARV